MGNHLARRLLQMIPVLLVSSVIVFYIIHLVPGDPATLLAGPDASPGQLQSLRHSLGEDRSIPQQYLIWLSHAAQGNLGRSFVSGRTTISLLRVALPVTLQLVIGGVILALLIGIPAGLVAGIRPGSVVDNAVSFLTALALGIPDFLMGITSLLIFALFLGWLPSGGYVNVLTDPVAGIKTLILPALALALPSAGVYARFVRGAIEEVMLEDFVRTARAKGLSQNAVLRRHVLRNALMPLVTIAGVQFGRLLGGAVIIETVFSWPGMGRLTVQAVQNKDYLVFQGAMLVLLFGAVAINFLVDVSYGLLDPRVRSA